MKVRSEQLGGYARGCLVAASCQPRTVEVAVEEGAEAVAVAVAIAVVRLPVEKNVKYQSRKSIT